MKPDIKRCFKLHTKKKNSQGVFNLKYYHFCIFGSADGSQSYSVNEASIAKEQWVIIINK